MVTSLTKKILYTLSCFALTLHSGLASAEDTEIYFSSTNSSSNAAIRPNVLLILDSSGSMTSIVPGTSPSQSRMEVMKEAMVDILNDMEDVNVGLMRFTYNDGGPVLFPIRYIDETIDNVVSEVAAATSGSSFVYTVSTGDNDGEETTLTPGLSVFPGTVTLTNAVLTLGEAPGSSGMGSPVTFTKTVNSLNDAMFEENGVTVIEELELNTSATGGYVGMRFTGVTIPQGASISSAILTLTGEDDTGDATATFTITGHNVDNSTTFVEGGSDISTRLVGAPTSATSPCTMTDTNPNEETRSSNDPAFSCTGLEAVIEEIVGRPGWASGNALSMILHSNNNRRDFHSLDSTNTTSKHPKITIEYTVSASPTDPEPQQIGLHFEEVNIPQGATVTSATITFTASSDENSSATFSIDAHDIDDSTALTSTAGDISGRTLTGTPVPWNPVDSFTTDTGYTTPDLTSVVQDIVSRTGWCGGNSMTFVISGTGTRYVHSYEGDSSKAPVLAVAYDPTSAAGCYQATETEQVSADYDDAEEIQGGSTDGDMVRTSVDLDIGEQWVGVRFTGVEVPQGAEILSAYLEFNAYGTSTTGNPTVTIAGEDIDDSDQFSSTDADITGRTQTTATVDWTTGDFTSSSAWYSTPDLKTIVQEIVNRGGWVSGNAMTLILATGANGRPAESHDEDPNDAPRLTINYKTNAGATQYKTVRQRLIELVNAMPTSDYTPIVETLYEAAHYWRGESVVYGKSLDGRSTSDLSHPASYCDADNSCNGADTTNYPPYGVNSTPSIQGSPNYISPFSSTLTCQSNYQVLLTDGAANSNELTTSSSINFLTSSCAASGTNRGTFATGEICGYDIVKFMHDNDQSSLTNDQMVSTFTVGFNLSTLVDATNFLKDLAEGGAGSFYEATTASDLISVFNVILSNVKSDPTSFVSPSLATNAFNRLLSRDEVYFGLFTPGLEQSWPGNVKKYNICVHSGGDDENTATTSDNCTLGEILDTDKVSAIDATTNKFMNDATSVWSDVVDGRETVKGGAGGEITDYTKRIIYTDTAMAPASGTSLNAAGYIFSEDTSTLANARWNHADLAWLRALVCPVPSTDTATVDGLDCQSRMWWMLGKIYTAADSDTSLTTRWSVNDVLHSSPAVITYGGASDDDGDGILNETGDDIAKEFFFDRIVVGTNEGGLRFINGATGAEEWVFMPEEVFSDQAAHFTNAEGDHLYGLDVTPTIRVIDVNDDGTINPTYDNDGDGSFESGEGDKVYVYIAMRAGGNFIYALDVTPANELTNNTTAIEPKFLWRIEGGTGDFTRLADTWSQPRIATIGVISGSETVPTDVLIFGGGYDNDLDTLENSGAGPNYNFGLEGGTPNMGNAVYIVDADTGVLIFSISHAADTSTVPVIAASGADIEVPNMYYAIPSRITLLDTDGDGLDDRLYFGDTVGQVWRVDLSEVKTSGTSPEGSTVVGRLANLSTAGTVADERRFFEPPAVVQVTDTNYSNITNGEYDYVLIGSGNRGHPLDTNVQDRFYALRDKFIEGMTDTTPKDNIADTDQYPNGASGVITNSNLIDITSTVLDSSNTTHTESLGWYFDFDATGTNGEKVMSAATAIAGAVFFTTYKPEGGTSVDLCAANIGGGKAYNFNILTTRAQVDWDEDGTLENTADRSMELGGGIPSDVVPVFTKEGVVGIVGIEGGAAQLGALTGLPRYRTYWYEED